MRTAQIRNMLFAIVTVLFIMMRASPSLKADGCEHGPDCLGGDEISFSGCTGTTCHDLYLLCEGACGGSLINSTCDNDDFNPATDVLCTCGGPTC
jgi:hypothetical protein